MPDSPTARPEPTEYHAGFGKYIQLAPDGDIQQFLAVQLQEMLKLLNGVSDSESLVHHAPHTWSVKQVVGHMTDCERIFGHRALWIARNNSTPLHTFDENAFMNFVDFDSYPLEELVTEFSLVRKSHLYFFKHLPPDAWLRRGIVIDQPASVRAFAYVIAGHAKHHLDILHRRLAR